MMGNMMGKNGYVGKELQVWAGMAADATQNRLGGKGHAVLSSQGIFPFAIPASLPHPPPPSPSLSRAEAGCDVAAELAGLKEVPPYPPHPLRHALSDEAAHAGEAEGNCPLPSSHPIPAPTPHPPPSPPPTPPPTAPPNPNPTHSHPSSPSSSPSPSASPRSMGTENDGAPHACRAEGGSSAM
ncbi:unnamed protein product [Closterium sp. Yama58-4]|nr:unnamed protein product [Closterium sp. Yama58-4]